jgi:hypothetical protein
VQLTYVKILTRLFSRNQKKRAMAMTVRIPMKTATDSDGKRPPVPIQSGHFGRGSILAARSSPLGDPLMSF